MPSGGSARSTPRRTSGGVSRSYTDELQQQSPLMAPASSASPGFGGGSSRFSAGGDEAAAELLIGIPPKRRAGSSSSAGSFQERDRKTVWFGRPGHGAVGISGVESDAGSSAGSLVGEGSAFGNSLTGPASSRLNGLLFGGGSGAGGGMSSSMVGEEETMPIAGTMGEPSPSHGGTLRDYSMRGGKHFWTCERVVLACALVGLLVSAPPPMDPAVSQAAPAPPAQSQWGEPSSAQGGDGAEGEGGGGEQASADGSGGAGGGEEGVCAGPCCSSRAPAVAGSTATMPSVWWSAALHHGAQVQLQASNGLWVGPRLPAGRWAEPGAYHEGAPASEFYTVEREDTQGHGSGVVRLRTPQGTYLTCARELTVTGLDASATPASLLSIEVVEGIPQKARIQCSDGSFIVVEESGILMRSRNRDVAEAFAVREAMQLPAFRGVGLPGWLVLEGWLRPDLFRRVPVYIDGLQFSLQSLYTGNFLHVDPANGFRLVAKGMQPGDWASFHMRTLTLGDRHQHEVRSLDFSYWSLHNSSSPPANASSAAGSGAPAAPAGGGGGMVEVRSDVANPGGEGLETFRFVFHGAEARWVMIQAPNGRFLSVNDDGSVTASVPAEQVNTAMGSWAWTTGVAFLLVHNTAVRGEWQMGRHWGPDEVEKRLEQHRSTWVTEEHFGALQQAGLNAVLVPVGYWIAEEGKAEGDVGAGGPLYPFSKGGLKYLDWAFDMAAKYGMRVLLSLHAAPGSQNGYEHSASRDGIPDWAASQVNIDRTVEAIDWFAQRYATNDAFAGIALLNEPLEEAISAETLGNYYERAYAAVRAHSQCAYVAISARVGAEATEVLDFLADEAQFTNVIHDEHFYNIFHDAPKSTATPAAAATDPAATDPAANTAATGDAWGGAGAASGNLSAVLSFVLTTRVKELGLLQPAGSERVAMVGEWSLAVEGHDSVDDAGMAGLASAQLAAYARARAGWFFFSHRMGRPQFPRFSFLDSLSRGWLSLQGGGGWY
ncbi:unnamed protein product [Closterium sp. NIES-54]